MSYWAIYLLKNQNQDGGVCIAADTTDSKHSYPEKTGKCFDDGRRLFCNVIIAAKEFFSPEHVQNAIARIDNASITPTGYNLFIKPKPLIFVQEVTDTPPPHDRKRCKF